MSISPDFWLGRIEAAAKRLIEANAPFADKCLECGHANNSHNELAYCQIGECGCETGRGLIHEGRTILDALDRYRYRPTRLSRSLPPAPLEIITPDGGGEAMSETDLNYVTGEELALRINQALELHEPFAVCDYTTGEKVVRGWACLLCCAMADLGKGCEHADGHSGVDQDHACRTRAILLGVKWE
jgi:hypothetical protein